MLAEGFRGGQIRATHSRLAVQTSSNMWPLPERRRGLSLLCGLSDMQYVTFSFIRAASNLLFLEISPPKKELSEDLHSFSAGLFVLVFFSFKCLTVMQKLYAVLLQCHILNRAYLLTRLNLK